MPDLPEVTINGADKSIHGFSIDAAQSNQDRLTGVFKSATGVQVTNYDDLVAIKVGLVPDLIFAGTVKNPLVSGWTDRGTPIQTAFSALDYNELATRNPITIAIPAGTLKAAATAVMNAMNADLPTALQVSLDTWAGNGPAMVDLNYVDTLPSAIFADLTTRSGWLSNITYFRKLLYWNPGSISAPWNIADGDGNRFGDMTVAQNRVDYANRIIVKYWWTGLKAHAFLGGTGPVTAGEQVVVGGQTYTFVTALTGVAGQVILGATNDISLGNLNAAINKAGGGQYDPSTVLNSSVESIYGANTLGVYAKTVGLNGNTIPCTTTCANEHWFGEGGVATITLEGGLDAGIGNRVTRNDLNEQVTLGFGVYTRSVEAPNVFTQADAESLGDAILVVSIIVQKVIVYQTRRAGLHPGMSQAIQCAKRNVNDTCLITNVRSVWIEGSIIERTITAVSGTIFKGSRWRDWWKRASSGASSISSTVVGSVPTGDSSTVRTVYFLGGTPEAAVQTTNGGVTWVAASGGTDGQGGIEFTIDSAVRGTLVGTVRVRLRSSSGSVTARLAKFEGGVSSSCGQSDPVTSTTFSPVVFPVNLFAGIHTYRLELLPSVTGADANGVGYFE